MEIIKPGTNYNFVGKMGNAVKFTLLLIIVALGSLIYHNGPNWGVEFTGGTEIHIKFPNSVETDDVSSKD